MCNLRLSLIKSPETYIYGVLFVIGAIVAATVNTIALIVLWMPSHRTNSNRILTSLVISDMLTGYIIFPLNAYEVLFTGALMKCTIDAVRSYLAVLVAGSSVLTLGFIAFDRYILLSKYTKHDAIITKKNITVMLLFSWIFPGVTPFVKYIAEIPYLILLILIFYGPFIALIVFYFLLMRVIYQTQQHLEAHSNNHSIEEINSISCSNANNHDATNSTPKSLKFMDILSPAIKSVSNAIKRKKAIQRNVKIAKSVSILLACYFFCLTPLNVWLILDIANTYHQYVHPLMLQRLYLFAICSGSFNSCINPFIYISKQPGFRKRLCKLFRRSSYRSPVN